MSPAVFPHALLPRVAYAVFHVLSDTFVQAGDTTGPQEAGTGWKLTCKIVWFGVDMLFSGTKWSGSIV